MQERAVMMEESLKGELRMTGLLAMVSASSARPFDHAIPHGSPVWASPGAWRTERTPRRSETRHIAPPTVIQRIVGALRLWRRRTRSRQQLRELNDHVLKDIGLSRETLCYEATRPVLARRLIPDQSVPINISPLRS